MERSVEARLPYGLRVLLSYGRDILRRQRLSGNALHECDRCRLLRRSVATGPAVRVDQPRPLSDPALVVQLQALRGTRMTDTSEIARRKALRSLRDCGVIRASKDAPGYARLVEDGHAIRWPWWGKFNYRLTANGVKAAGKYRGYV